MSLDLARHTFRLLAWKPLFASSASVIAVCFVLSIGDEFDMTARFIVARASVLVVAAALPFLIDDAVAQFTGALPTPLRVRRAHKIIVIAIPWALAVAVTLMLAARNLPTDLANPFPYVRLATEALALAAIACCIAAAVGRRVDQPGRRAATLLIMLGTAVAAIPPPAQPWMTPFDPQYAGMSVNAWWTLIAVVSMGFLIFSWDARTKT